MRFLLYNIRYGAGIGSRFHLPFPYSGYFKPINGHFNKIVDFIEAVNPDILGLVEVDFGTYRVEKRNQAETIAAVLNHQAVYGSKYNVGSMARKMPLLSKQGNAVLTNEAIIDRRFHFLNNGVKRLVIEVELTNLTIFLVHLSLKFRHRQYQLNELHTLIANSPKPVVVAGDFNSLWGDRELQLFMAATGLTSANSRGEFSYPSRTPMMTLDYIFHSPELRTIDFQVPQIQLSDHVPLLWEFEIARSQQQAPPPTLIPESWQI